MCVCVCVCAFLSIELPAIVIWQPEGEHVKLSAPALAVQHFKGNLQLCNVGCLVYAGRYYISFLLVLLPKMTG